jgi:hypothetical protein
MGEEQCYSKVVGYYMVLLCQWLCHLCGELWYHTCAEGFTYVSFTHTQCGALAEDLEPIDPIASCLSKASGFL